MAVRMVFSIFRARHQEATLTIALVAGLAKAGEGFVSFYAQGILTTIVTLALIAAEVVGAGMCTTTVIVRAFIVVLAFCKLVSGIAFEARLAIIAPRRVNALKTILKAVVL